MNSGGVNDAADSVKFFCVRTARAPALPWLIPQTLTTSNEPDDSLKISSRPYLIKTLCPEKWLQSSHSDARNRLWIGAAARDSVYISTLE